MEEDICAVTSIWPQIISRELRHVKVAHVSLLFFFPGIWRQIEKSQVDGGVELCGTH